MYTIQGQDPHELYHHGVKGMKWGVHRNKNEATKAAQMGMIYDRSRIKTLKKANARNETSNNARKKKRGRNSVDCYSSSKFSRIYKVS